MCSATKKQIGYAMLLLRQSRVPHPAHGQRRLRGTGRYDAGAELAKLPLSLLLRAETEP